MKRLYKRTSKCSLESLSICGERKTQKRLILVGNETTPFKLHSEFNKVVLNCLHAVSIKSLLNDFKSIRNFIINLKDCYLKIFVTKPEPTVRPPSRIANRIPFSIAIGEINSIFIVTLSPGITISILSPSELKSAI